MDIRGIDKADPEVKIISYIPCSLEQDLDWNGG